MDRRRNAQGQSQAVQHRLFFGGEPGQSYEDGGYLREYEQAAVCTGYEDGKALLSQRNRFFRGETLEVLEPGGAPYPFLVRELYDEAGEPLEAARHPMQTVRVPAARAIAVGAILRPGKEMRAAHLRYQLHISGHQNHNSPVAFDGFFISY